MLSVLRGEPTDVIPWAPRLDLWYNARKRAGTLPPEYRDADLRDITDDLGFGYHAIVPHFRDLRGPDDDLHRALGIHNLWSMPYATILHNVDIEKETRGDSTHVTYRTPMGTVTTTAVYDEAMRAAGVSITHISEHAIKGHRDYPAVAYLFENAEVVPNVAGYRGFVDFVGDRGIAAGYLSLAASPMHLLQRELMPMELFYYELYDHPEEQARCAATIGDYLKRVFDVCAASQGDLFLLGANYDASVTHPPFFAEHITPWLKAFADTLHAKGKFLLTHTDGENTGLLDCYLESAIDVAESVCPAPMTKLTFKEVRDHFRSRITIMGGIPSICLLPDVVPDAQFDTFLEGFFSDLGSGDHLILGISDTTPPAAELDRIIRIAECVRTFGPPGGPGQKCGASGVAPG